MVVLIIIIFVIVASVVYFFSFDNESKTRAISDYNAAVSRYNEFNKTYGMPNYERFLLIKVINFLQFMKKKIK